MRARGVAHVLRKGVAGARRQVARKRAKPPPASESVAWCVDELIQLRDRIWVSGWIHNTVEATPITDVWLRFPDGEPQPARHGLPRPDVAEVHGPGADACGFEFATHAPPDRYVDELLLGARAGRETVEFDHLVHPHIETDPYHTLEKRFWDHLEQLPRGRVLEMGSRARSGNTRRDRIHDRLEYVGLDIVEGPNVDVVGDGHELDTLFPPHHFDAVFALSVFEHLLMPWKAAAGINRVLRPGGWVLVGTHQTFPLHDRPWDFWRYSNDAWRGLFNSATGFRIVDVAMGERAAIVPLASHAITRDTHMGEAYMAAGVIAEKVADTDLRWQATVAEILEDPYPG